jgi:hypothetical protein
MGFDMRKSCIACVTLLGLCFGTSCYRHQSEASGSLFQGPIDAAWNSSQSTVLVVPTNETDRVVQQRIHDYVRATQKMLMERVPGREMTILTDAEALQSDLSQSSLFVYGTPPGNLWLAKYMPSLPVAIEPSGITTDRLYKGSGLRFISTWPHPQNPERGVTLYTAQRAQDVVGIHAVTHGLTDYVVARDRTIVQAAGYINKDTRWACPPYELNPAQATEDLDFMFKTIERVHPNCRANLSKADYKALKERSHAALKAVNDDRGTIPVSSLALIAAEAAAAIGDGHTSCWLLSGLVDPCDPSPCMPPFRLRWIAGQVVIDTTIPGLEHLAGARLLRINGKPFSEAMEPILSRSSGELHAFRMICFLNNQETRWALIRPIDGNEMTVTIRRGTDEPERVEVPLISLAQYRRELPPIRFHHNATEFHHEGRTCYWQYNSFDASDRGKQAVDVVFKDIHDRGVQNLVIDLRFNGGGDSRASEHILNYLTDKPYRLFSRGEAKVSRELLKSEQWGVIDLLISPFRGGMVGGRCSMRQPQDTDYRFTGSVYAIIGPGSFSTASDFAHILKDFHIGTLVGEETGGLRQCFGNCPSFTMPHSNLRFSVSTKLFYAPIPQPNDAVHGSLPDIPVVYEQLAPYAGTDDPELAFALDLVANQTASK